jgi:hypothetical protein
MAQWRLSRAALLSMMTLLLAVLVQAETVADRAIQPQAAVDGEGRIHVVYIAGGNIVVRSSADGKTWGESVTAIDAKGRAKGGMQRGPRIGADAKGGLAVTAPACFDDKEFEKQYPTNELWIVRSADGGKTWSKPQQINEAAKKAPESLHWMAMAPNGDVHVAWLDLRDGATNCLWYARVAGDKVGRNAKISGPVCECCAPGLAVDDRGNPFIVVREGKKSDRAILMTVSRDGGKSFAPPAPVNPGRTGLGN